jgi:hypothetical protein
MDGSKRDDSGQETQTRTFDPRPYLRRIRTRGQESEYLDVKWRLAWLRTEHPDAQITTEHIMIDDQGAVFRAMVQVPGGGSATGYGSETRGDFVDYIEKAETKAIGRALAALGYGTQFALDFDLEEEPEGRPWADSPVERQAAGGHRGQRQRATADRRAETRSAQRERPAKEAGGDGETSAIREDAGDDDFNPADYSWNEFWPWARRRGYRDKAMVEETLGRSIDGMTPREVRSALQEDQEDEGKPGEDIDTTVQP